MAELAVAPPPRLLTELALGLRPPALLRRLAFPVGGVALALGCLPVAVVVVALLLQVVALLLVFLRPDPPDLDLASGGKLFCPTSPVAVAGAVGSRSSR